MAIRTSMKNYVYMKVCNVCVLTILSKHTLFVVLWKFSSVKVYACKHGLKPRTKATDNSRPNQHLFFTNCPCNITFSHEKK